jgi:hypothetical protein
MEKVTKPLKLSDELLIVFVITSCLSLALSLGFLVANISVAFLVLSGVAVGIAVSGLWVIVQNKLAASK